MERKPRELGSNRQMAHHVARPERSREPSDRQLLAKAQRDAAKWQAALAKQRRAEAST